MSMPKIVETTNPLLAITRQSAENRAIVEQRTFHIYEHTGTKLMNVQPGDWPDPPSSWLLVGVVHPHPKDDHGQ